MRALALACALAAPTAAQAWDRPLTSWSPPNELERRIIDRALRCVRMRKPADPLYLLDLLRLEESAGVPRRIRGMVLAAACSESGFDPEATGDPRGGRRMAVGVLQQWPWWERHFQFDRTNPMRAAEFWLAHIMDQIPRSRRLCGRHLKGEKLWHRAWVHGVRGPKKGGRCDEISKHYLRLNRWRRNWWKLVFEWGKPR